MRTLYLLRHSKTNAESATGRDFDRSLAERGVLDSATVGEFISDIQPLPQIIISSPALRARETAEAVNMNLRLDIQFDQRIYEARVGTLVEIIGEISADINCAVLIGHNPGFERLVEYLTGENVAMPTSALAIIEIKNTEWNSIGRDCVLSGMHTPKHGFAELDPRIK